MTAPLGSVTVPWMSPEIKDWAMACVASATKAAISASEKIHLLFMFESPSSSSMRVGGHEHFV
jgi:hypothetical protein